MPFDRLKRRDFITFLGGAAAWPVAARAQQPGMPVIGYLQGRSPETSLQLNEAFRQGLREEGFVEGQNVAIEYRFANGRFDLLPALAAELVSQRVAVIAAIYPSSRAAKAATSTIPIVFIGGSDPVLGGLVSSLNRPGGNITGVSLLAADLETKRIGLLREIIPQNTVIGALIDRTDPIVYPESEISQQELQAAARRLNVSIQLLNIAGERDFDTAFDTLVQDRVGALIVTASVFFNINRDRLIALSARHAVPTIYENRDFVAAGGLISYGTSFADIYRQGGVYVSRILKGAKPAELPVLLPTKFGLVLNLKTAEALKVTMPSGVLAIADEVIE
jgi:putative ABC transport system substrate-binding protein